MRRGRVAPLARGRLVALLFGLLLQHVSVSFLTAAGPRPAAPGARRNCRGGLHRTLLCSRPEVATALGEAAAAAAEGEATPASQRKRVGRPHTPISRARISAANKGRVPWNAGRKHSDETRRRIAEGTRVAIKRKHEAHRAELLRLRDEEPDAYAKLLAAAAKAAVRRVEAEHSRNERRRVARLAVRRREKARAAAEAAAHGTPVPLARPARVGGRRANFTFTAESRAKISASLKTLWQDPAYRERRKRLNVSSETRAAISETMRAKWRDGTYRKRVCVNGTHSPERRARIAESIRAKWADPDYRKRTLDGIRRSHSNQSSRRQRLGPTAAETRLKISNSMKKLWGEASYRDRQLESIRAQRANNGGARPKYGGRRVVATRNGAKADATRNLVRNGQAANTPPEGVGLKDGTILTAVAAPQPTTEEVGSAAVDAAAAVVEVDMPARAGEAEVEVAAEVENEAEPVAEVAKAEVDGAEDEAEAMQAAVAMQASTAMQAEDEDDEEDFVMGWGDAIIDFADTD